MATIQTLNNGVTFGEQRGKINQNFENLNNDKAEISTIITKTNTTPFTPSGQYNPATKGYVDNAIVGVLTTYDPGNISGNAFDRSNHIGTQPANSIVEDTDNRFVSDSQIATWNAKEPAIVKNTGFNKNFGTSAGTVSEGNHAHIDYEPVDPNIQIHITNNSGNPHNVTPAMIGAEVANPNIQAHIIQVVGNPHNVTKSQVGLGNVDNTADLDKPVSVAMFLELDQKADKTNPIFGNFELGNYATFTENGELVLAGEASVWDDVTFPLIAQNIDSGVGTLEYNYANSSITADANGGIEDANDLVTLNCQIPHKAKLNGLAHFHIHWEQATAQAYTFDFKYRIQKQGQLKASSWSTPVTVGMSNNVFTYSTGTLNQITELLVLDLAALGVGLSDIIQVQFTRSDGTAGDIEIVTADFHFEIDSLGSNEEYEK